MLRRVVLSCLVLGDACDIWEWEGQVGLGKGRQGTIERK